jgi:hypothetical protein
MSDTFDVESLRASVLDRVHTTALLQDPFPHLIVCDALPLEYYRRLIDTILPAARFCAAQYPGTGRFTARHGGRPEAAQGPLHHGLVLRDWSGDPLAALHAALADDAFARALLDRFSAPGSYGDGTAIPLSKHHWFGPGTRAYSCVFALHKDPPGYEISPHLDNPAKIVTFLLYLDDDAHDPCATLLCRPQAGLDASMMASNYGSAHREGRTGLWEDWANFDVVKAVYGANMLLAFAPNDASYHGVRLPANRNRKERTVVRGFVARRGYGDTTVLADGDGVTS